MSSTAELRFATKHAEVVASALRPELSEKIPRTRVSVGREGHEVTVRIEAEDGNALRAALNSYIRWMNVAEETAEEATGR